MRHPGRWLVAAVLGSIPACFNCPDSDIEYRSAEASAPIPISLLASNAVAAQGQSAPRFASLSAPEFACHLPECNAAQREHHRLRLSHSVLVGALIGGGVGLLTAVVAGGFCGLDDSADARPCGETVALTFGITVGTGALIGLLVGASEPSRGPVPTD